MNGFKAIGRIVELQPDGRFTEMVLYVPPENEAEVKLLMNRQAKKLYKNLTQGKEESP